MDWIAISGNSLLFAFFVYIAAFLVFTWAVTGRVATGLTSEEHQTKWGRNALIVTGIGFALHLVYFFSRWAGAGFIPTSNMFEFITLLSMMVVLALIVLYVFTAKPVIGVFAVPLAIILIAYASVFPREVKPLIPALQSYWLKIHVTMAALGEAFFAIGFAAGLMYLLRTVDYTSNDRASVRARRWLEVVIGVVLSVVVFCGLIFGFKSTGVLYSFEDPVSKQTAVYALPPVIGPLSNLQPDGTELVTYRWAGIDMPIAHAPSWMKGQNAARKLNTIVWTLFGTVILYALLRVTIARRGIGARLSGMTKSMVPEDLDELSYRTIAIGYPIFALGGLVFAMIWAKEAWGRFWDNDPKEVWAAIVFLFYTAYLHLRLSRSWSGSRSAWMTVIGFLIVMFTLVGVNLMISGLHSYAGV